MDDQSIAPIAGVDEAGRGALAGPVVAAAVILPELDGSRELKDSKTLTPKKREALYEAITAEAIAWSVGLVEPGLIDEINILRATERAMTEAVAGLSHPPARVKVDGRVTLPLNCPYQCIPHGDAMIEVISAASIIAKVTRDRLMVAYEKVLPQYGFAGHKGYGTQAHRQALADYGVSPIHRLSFAPCQQWAENCLSSD